MSNYQSRMAKINQITLGRLQILRYLVNCTGWVLPIEVLDNVKPDGITTLHGVRKALNELECVEMKNITPAGRPNYQCRMKTDPVTFHILVTKAFDHDRDSRTVFMRSQYYRGLTSDLVQRFKGSIPDNDLVKLATHEHPATRDQPLTEDDEWLLTKALGANWLALKWVEHFISVEADERGSILQQLLESVRNSKISPAAAHAAGCARGFYDGMVEARPWIVDKVITKITINENGTNEKVQLTYASACRQADPDSFEHRPTRDELCINWEELFNQLDNLNSNYQYLFD